MSASLIGGIIDLSFWLGADATTQHFSAGEGGTEDIFFGLVAGKRVLARLEEVTT